MKSKQITFSDIEYGNRKRITKREEFLDIMAEYQDNIRMAGTLRSEIDKADNAADKLRLALECIECMTGEVGFAKRNLKGVNQDD